MKRKGKGRGKGRGEEGGGGGGKGGFTTTKQNMLPISVSCTSGARHVQLRNLISLLDDLIQRFKMNGESSALQLLTLVSMFAPYRTQTAGLK